MRIRRCSIVVLEPRERLVFDLALLADGGSGLHHVVEWVALAPHLGAELVLANEEALVLGALSPSQWCDLDEAGTRHPRAILDGLLAKGLLIGEAGEAGSRDRMLRDTHWRPVSAAMHYASRWRDVDTEQSERDFQQHSRRSMLDHLGSAPPPVRETAGARLALAAAEQTPLEGLLRRRVTCRNHDRSRALGFAEFSAVMYRTFGARAVDDSAAGMRILKKSAPSAGGLHATEAYVLVQRVEGVACGLHHYHPIDHALVPIKSLDAAEARALAKRFVAAQDYFADAHALVVPTSRFARNFWKYRNHAKAYRALILDVGHLSQTLYLAATELGLGAFVTAAINEVDIEQAFGLDPLEEGPLAVCGFGLRAAERAEVEFDPLHAIWPD